MSLLKSDKLKYILLPDFGWPVIKEGNYLKLWIDLDRNYALSLSYFKKAPVIPTIQDIHALRRWYRQGITKSGGGIIEIDIKDFFGIPVVRSIFKVPGEAEGVTYIGSITIPFSKSSYVIKLEAPEKKEIGLRDKIIADKLLADHVITVNDNGSENWIFDPYDPNFKSSLLMNRAEEQQYDSAFPDHPLTKLRMFLDEIEKGIVFYKKIYKMKTFDR
jgi:hypothetical protein